MIKKPLRLIISLAVLAAVFLAGPTLALTYAAPQKDPVITEKQLNQGLQQNKIVQDLQEIVNFLSAGVGIVVTGAIIVGGIQYSIAGDNQQKLTDAKKRITNAVIALAMFIFMFAFIQWLIPGGVFG
jgi:hypothetical protein